MNIVKCCRRWNSFLVVLGFVLFGLYLFAMKAVTKPGEINVRELKRQIDNGKPVRVISYEVSGVFLSKS